MPDPEKALQELEPTIQKIVKYHAAHLPACVSLDELMSEARMAVLQCLPRYDRNKGDLKAFAAARIKGALLDYLRSLDPLSRDHRQDIKAGLVDQVHVLSLDQADPYNQGLDYAARLRDREPLPDSKIEALEKVRDDKQLLLNLLANSGLMPRTLKILRLYYFGDRTMYQIGQSEGINESRVSQILRGAINKIRGRCGVGPLPIQRRAEVDMSKTNKWGDVIERLLSAKMGTAVVLDVPDAGDPEIYKRRLRSTLYMKSATKVFSWTFEIQGQRVVVYRHPKGIHDIVEAQKPAAVQVNGGPSRGHYDVVIQDLLQKRAQLDQVIEFLVKERGA